MADDFEIRAFQGKGESFIVTLSGGTFVGEPLAATIGAGDTSPAALTITPTWVAPVAPETAYTQVALSFTATQLSTLTQGPYSILVSLADSSAALAKGFLEVYPAPGGISLPYYRCLASPAFAQSFLPELSREQLDTLPAALVTATRAIESYVGRPLILDSYDHILRPNNSIRFRLKARPVVEVSRVSSDVIAGAILSNSTSTASAATVQTITTGPNSLQIKSLVFALTISGVTTTQTITMSGYNTFGDLVTAINALGNGWGASSQPPFSSLPVADAFGTPGVRGVLREEPWIHTHSQRLGWYWSDPEQGYVELNEPIPGGFLIRNPRVERSDTRYWGVRFTYRAGYAVTAADIALGYYPVPEDLQTACVMTANNIIETVPMMGPLISQSVKDRSYTLRDDPSIIPRPAQMLLQRYQDFVC